MPITLEHIEAEQAKVSELIAKFKANQSRQFNLPAITLDLASGEECAGLVLTSEGKPSHYLILLPNEAKDVTFNEAVEWAKEQGGDLPSREEQALLLANLKKHFQPEYYWSGIEHPSNKGYAFVQYFGSGYQDSNGKYDKVRARAVRRFNA